VGTQSALQGDHREIPDTALAGAWAYHAGAFVVTILPLLAWMIRGLTRLQAWATQALLGTSAA
jgi:hypothetical protein